MPVSPRLRSNVDGVANDQRVRSGRDLSSYASVSGQDDDRPLDLTAKTSLTPARSEHQPEVYQPADTDTVETNGNSQLPVRKTSRRKGIAHKLDTTSINQWPASDVTNEPFDLVPVSTSPRTAAGPQQSPSPRTSSPGTAAQNFDAATKNEVGHTEDSSTERQHITASAGLQRELTTAEIGGGGGRGDADEDGSAAGDVGGRGSLECTEAGRGAASTLSGQECRHCGFVFRHPAMFDIHMGFHKFDEPWRCNRCGRRCADCVDFNRHIAAASHHGQV